ncbi:unnamed protein product [Urochloa humidicola]
MDSSATRLGGSAEWAAPALKDLLPELSREEQLRLQNRGLGNRDMRKLKGRKAPPSPPPFSMAPRTERERDALLIKTVQDALGQYNARHQGGEFDAVKPLMEQRVGFRGQVWFHLNFWARSRSTNKIKRFFAEVHYQPSSNNTVKYSGLTPIVETCTIVEEPLSQYRTTCAFCPASFDILHPKGCRKFVCGNDKDRIGQRLVRCKSMWLESPFTCPIQRERRDPASSSSSALPSQ